MIERKQDLIEYLSKHPSDKEVCIQFEFDVLHGGEFTLGIIGIEEVFDSVCGEEIRFLKIKLGEI